MNASLQPSSLDVDASPQPSLISCVALGFLHSFSGRPCSLHIRTSQFSSFPPFWFLALLLSGLILFSFLFSHLSNGEMTPLPLPEIHQQHPKLMSSGGGSGSRVLHTHVLANTCTLPSPIPVSWILDAVGEGETEPGAPSSIPALSRGGCGVWGCSASGCSACLAVM